MKSPKVGIYKITNLCNGKIYIGQSNDIYRRWKNHKCNANNPNSSEYDSLIHRAFRKYDISNFRLEIIEECSIDDLDSKECYWIAYYDATDLTKGYNLALGGEGTRTWSVSDDEQLTNLTVEGYSIQEICKIMGRSSDSISGRKTYLGISCDNSWTDEEILLLKKLFDQNISIREISEKLCRTISSVRHKINRLNLFYRARWSQYEEDKLLQYVQEGRTNKEISQLINRPYFAVKSKRYELTHQND